MSEHHKTSAWEGAVIYQVYIRSFKEVRENPIGEGNLAGVISELDYLQDLGINAVWLSPFYPSPMVDGGYDIADHTDVDPRYGTLDDFDKLSLMAHERGIKIMLDFAPNHTSDQHPWFLQSKKSRDNPKSDWYIWADPAPDGGQPNNWASVFSLPQLEARKRGELKLPDDELTPPLSAWEFCEERGQYYLHTFAVEQPDLNWTNPDVREAMKNVMRFWLKRGVDGFRVDAVNHVAKNPDLPDEDHNPNYIEGIDNPYNQLKRENSANYVPALKFYLGQMADVLREYSERDLRLIFEAYVDDALLEIINEIAPDVASAFNFTRLEALWEAPEQQELIDEYHQHLPKDALPNEVNGNHDKPRLASRLGERAARVAAVINLTLPGMIFIYNGEEGGFRDVEIPLEEMDDFRGERDPARTPMMWNAGENSGFSAAKKTWLPISKWARRKNLTDQKYQPVSSLWLYKTLLGFRNSSPILTHGSYRPVETNQKEVVAFAREFENDQVITIANFCQHEVFVKFPAEPKKPRRIMISSIEDRRGEKVSPEKGISLLGEEAVVIINSA